MPRRVVCIDRSRCFAELFAVAIGLEADLECVGIADSVATAIELLSEEQVDVVLLDADRRGLDGTEGVRRIKRNLDDLRVVVMTSEPTLDLVVRAASAGADDFVAKDAPLSEILRAIRSTHEGIELDDATLATLRRRISAEGQLHGHAWDPRLTERERDVLGLLAEGMDPQTIARHLGITVHTSRGYVRNVLAKLGAHSQLEAVVIATRAGIVHGPGSSELRSPQAS